MPEVNFSCYYDSNSINKTVTNVILLGAEYFKRAYIIQYLDELRTILNNRENEIIDKEDFNNSLKPFFFEKLTDSIKICLFFENYMKAILLSQDYVIHKINRGKDCDAIAKQQITRPVKTKELHDVKGFIIDDLQKIVHHNALSNQTLKISILLSKKYSDVIQLPDEIRTCIMQLVEQRNEHHFISEMKFELNKRFLNSLEQVNKYVDDILLLYIPNQ